MMTTKRQGFTFTVIILLVCKMQDWQRDWPKLWVVMLAGLAPTVFGVMMNITGSTLANWWHNRDPDTPRPEKKKK